MTRNDRRRSVGVMCSAVIEQNDAHVDALSFNFYPTVDLRFSARVCKTVLILTGAVGQLDLSLGASCLFSSKSLFYIFQQVFPCCVCVIEIPLRSFGGDSSF